MSARYVPGPAAVLVGRNGLVATGAEHASALVTLADTDLVVLAVIDALSGGSLADLPAFGCVVRDGDDLRIVVRGGFTVSAQGQEWSGEGVATWREHTLPGAAGTEATLRAGDAEAAGELPIGSGVVLASRVVWSGAAEAPAASAYHASAGAVPAAPGAPAAPAAAEVPAAPQPPAAPETAPEPIAAPVPPPPPATPQAGPAVPPPPPTPVAGVVPVAPLDPELTFAEPDLEFDAMFGATILGRRPEDAAVRDDEAADADEASAVAAAPADPTAADAAPAAEAATPGPEPVAAGEDTPPHAGDHDGRTITAAQLQALRERAAGRSNAPKAAIVLPSGERHDIAPRLLIGRRPQARQVPTAEVPTLVTVEDPYVSGTHLEFTLQGDDLLVTDLSTNGTVLIRPGLPPQQLDKTVPTSVPDGTRLALSDDLTVHVELKAGV